MLNIFGAIDRWSIVIFHDLDRKYQFHFPRFVFYVFKVPHLPYKRNLEVDLNVPPFLCSFHARRRIRMY